MQKTIKHKRQNVGTNEMLRMLQDCKDVDLLFMLLNEEETSNSVKRRCRHKLFCMWAEKSENIIRSNKAKATREKNKLIKAKKESENDSAMIVQAAIRAAQKEKEAKANNSAMIRVWVDSPLSMYCPKEESI